MLYALYALLAGATSAFAFEPTGLWALLLLAFALLCELLCRAHGVWRALLIGWAFGLGQFVIGLNWIATAFTYQAAMPAWLGWVAVVLVSLFLAIYPALAAGLAWRLGRDNRAALVLVLGGAWAVTEWLRGTMFTGFPWNPAAAALAPTALIKVTALVGTYGLSGLAALLGGALWLGYHRKWLSPALIVGSAALLWLLPASDVPPAPLTLINVRIVQPNIGEDVKHGEDYNQLAGSRLAALSGPPSGEPRLLLWPEAALTVPLQDARTDGHDQIAQLQRAQLGSLLGPDDRLLTGGTAIDSKDGVDVGGAANSVFVLDPNGNILGRYDKAHLVPYGEYLPMRPFLSAIGLSRLAPGDLEFSSGPGPRTIDVGGHWGKVAFQICYEIIFPGEVVDEKNRPAFIFNPSNDSWFGSWASPQQLAQSRLRAAEEGLPVIRATPTGISALVDARGQIVKSLPWRTAGVIDAVLPPAAKALTPFARFGNAIPLLLGLFLIIGGIVLGRHRR